MAFETFRLAFVAMLREASPRADAWMARFVPALRDPDDLRAPHRVDPA